MRPICLFCLALCEAKKRDGVWKLFDPGGSEHHCPQGEQEG
jgi:hypothetical protein